MRLKVHQEVINFLQIATNTYNQAGNIFFQFNSKWYKWIATGADAVYPSTNYLDEPTEAELKNLPKLHTEVEVAMLKEELAHVWAKLKSYDPHTTLRGE